MDKFVASLWDWGFLDGCFGSTRSRVGDVDGIIEHAGEVLMLEGKPLSLAPTVGDTWLESKSQWNGQARLWKGLAGRGISILVLWGEATDQANPMIKVPDRMQLWLRHEDTPHPVQTASVDLVRARVCKWWWWAERCSKDRP